MEVCSQEMVLFNRTPCENTNLNTCASCLLKRKFDYKVVFMLEHVIKCSSDGTPEEQKYAINILTRFKKDPDSWTKVDKILVSTSNAKTTSFALEVLEDVVNTRWKTLSDRQCEGIKKFIINVLVNVPSKPEVFKEKRSYFNSINNILLQILKNDWPRKWPTFLSNIAYASKSNENRCWNNMTILKTFSEKILLFGGKMSCAKKKYIQDTLLDEFLHIYHLCFYIMNTFSNLKLLKLTIEVLLQYLHWIPSEYVFKSTIFITLIEKFFTVPFFQNISLECLTKIGGTQYKEYYRKSLVLFTRFMHNLQKVFPLTMNIKEAYAKGKDEEKKLIYNLSIYLCVILKEHGMFIQNKEYNYFSLALNYLLAISKVEDIKITKPCMEYWKYFAANLHRKQQNQEDITKYRYVLFKLRTIIVNRISRPENILIKSDDEILDRFKTDDSLYRTMQNTLVHLVYLNYVDTKYIIFRALKDQVRGAELSTDSLNSLCSAIGSISKCIPKEDGKSFFLSVIKGLLILGKREQKEKKNKINIALNMMHVLGQYPHFFQADWNFLKLIIKKLFEFMHDNHDDMQAMACDTFIKIARECRRQFVTLQDGETVPYVEELLRNMNTTICDLKIQYVPFFYEAVGYIIESHLKSLSVENTRRQAIRIYMARPNRQLNCIVKSPKIWQDPKMISNLIIILKINLSVCKAMGYSYAYQLNNIHSNVFSIYQEMSKHICIEITKNDKDSKKDPFLIKKMGIVRKKILNLVSCWISSIKVPAKVCTNTSNTRSNPTATETLAEKRVYQVFKNFMPNLYMCVLADYSCCPEPSAREPEVLSMLAVIVNTLKEHMAKDILKILNYVLDCTIFMIKKNFEDFPEHRKPFILFLQAIITHCLPVLFNINTLELEKIVHSIIWAFKHYNRKDVAEIGLQTLTCLFINVKNYKEDAQKFYEMYYFIILKHLLFVLIEESYTIGLTLRAKIMTHMLNLVVSGEIKQPLNPKELDENNTTCVFLFFAHFLSNEFPHLTDFQIGYAASGFFELRCSIASFEEYLKNFTILMDEFYEENENATDEDDNNASI